MKKKLYDSEYYSRGKSFDLISLISNYLTVIDFNLFLGNFTDGDFVLEVGCGEGKMCNMLANRGFKIDAVDISGEAIKLALKNNNKVNYVWGDVFSLRSKSNKYDVVYSLHVMEHIKEFGKNIVEIKRILKKGGKFVVRIPNSDSFEAKIAGEKWFHWDEPYHVNHWKYGEFSQILLEHGYKNIKLNFGLFEYKQVLLYSILSRLGFNMKKTWIRILVVPLQIVFVPISLLLGYVFKNSGTVEIVVENY